MKDLLSHPVYRSPEANRLYLDDHVIILNDDWSVYTFSPEELTRELDFIDPR